MVSLSYPSSATDQDQQAVDWLTHFFVTALADEASDIHLEPFENVLRVRVRIDGHLQERPPPCPVYTSAPAEQKNRRTLGAYL